MKFSLVTIIKEYEGFIDGVWIQHHCGTLETAITTARETEKVNGQRTTNRVAVVEELNFSGQNYSVFRKLKRLD